MGSLFSGGGGGGGSPAPAPVQIIQPPTAPSGPQPVPGASTAAAANLALLPGETPEQRARRLAQQSSILGYQGDGGPGGSGGGNGSGPGDSGSGNSASADAGAAAAATGPGSADAGSGM